jgi:hypothetical protein
MSLVPVVRQMNLVYILPPSELVDFKGFLLWYVLKFKTLHFRDKMVLVFRLVSSKTNVTNLTLICV